ncbi:MAG: hypothetical protein H0X51_05670 [Parachlamydiaceae bacterium]|nr:hypothetical protein [Parachlamydiaceae bacterium]
MCTRICQKITNFFCCCCPTRNNRTKDQERVDDVAQDSFKSPKESGTAKAYRYLQGIGVGLEWVFGLLLVGIFARGRGTTQPMPEKKEEEKKEKKATDMKV